MREINFCPIEGEIAYEADTGKIFVYHNQQYVELYTKVYCVISDNMEMNSIF